MQVDQQGGCDRDILAVHHKLGALALTWVEAVEAVGRGCRRVQAA